MMKVIQEPQRIVCDFTIEEIKEVSCPVCLAEFEYMEKEMESKQEECPPYGIWRVGYILCPCCGSKIILNYAADARGVLGMI